MTLPLPTSLRDLWAASILQFIKEAYFCGKPTWSVDNIQDLSGKTVLITGGNAGIGKETAKVLLRRNANVYLACRDQQRAESAIKDLFMDTGKNATFLNLDLADLKSVKAAVEEFTNKEKELHILFNNGGVMFPPLGMVADGYDMQMHVNVLGHFYLTKLLLPTLLATAEHAGKGHVRVLITSSSAHYLAKADPLKFDTFKEGPARRNYTTEEMYIQSKFANVVFAKELSRLYANQGLVVLSCNPGNLKTSLNRHVTDPILLAFLLILQLYPPEWGALTLLWGGTSVDCEQSNGQYLIPWAKVGHPRMDTENPQLGRELWAWLEDQVKDA